MKHARVWLFFSFLSLVLDRVYDLNARGGFKIGDDDDEVEDAFFITIRA